MWRVCYQLGLPRIVSEALGLEVFSEALPPQVFYSGVCVKVTVNRNRLAGPKAQLTMVEPISCQKGKSAQHPRSDLVLGHMSSVVSNRNFPATVPQSF